MRTAAVRPGRGCGVNGALDAPLMRVVYVTESHEARAGGIPTVVDQLARQVGSAGVDTEIVSVGVDPLPAPPRSKLTNAKPARVSGPWRWSRGLRRDIEAAAKRLD